MSKSGRRVISELKKGLRGLYGQRLRRLILYGSHARAEAGPDSDIDIAVLLAGSVSPTAEIERMLDIITDINLKHNVLVSVYPLSNEKLLNIRSPLLMNIRKEGIAL